MRKLSLLNASLGRCPEAVCHSSLQEPKPEIPSAKLFQKCGIRKEAAGIAEGDPRSPTCSFSRGVEPRREYSQESCFKRLHALKRPPFQSISSLCSWTAVPLLFCSPTESAAEFDMHPPALFAAQFPSTEARSSKKSQQEGRWQLQPIVFDGCLALGPFIIG